MSKKIKQEFYTLRRIIQKQLAYSDIKGVDLEQYVYTATWLLRTFGKPGSLWLPLNLQRDICSIDMLASQQDKVLHVYQVLIDSQRKVKTVPCEGVRLQCPCGERATLTETRHGPLYVCMHCDRQVKAHAGDKWPMGDMADRHVRFVRSECHRLFSELQDKWQLPTPRQAYRKLAEEMDCPSYLCHIGYIKTLPQGMLFKDKLVQLLHQ